MRAPELGPRPELERRSSVVVSEPGIRPWEGEVLSVKPGAGSWWVEVRDADGIAWACAEAVVSPTRGMR